MTKFSISFAWVRTLLLWPALVACHPQDDVAEEYDNIILQTLFYRQQTVFFYCKSFSSGFSAGMLAFAPSAAAITSSNTFFTSSCLTNVRLQRDTLLVSLMPGPTCEGELKKARPPGPVLVLHDGQSEGMVDMRVDEKVKRGTLRLRYPEAPVGHCNARLKQTTT